MIPVRERIFAEIERRLSLITAPEVAEVRRMPSGSPTRLPALFLFDQGDTPLPDEEEVDTAAFLLSVGIDGFLAGDDAHSAANALYAAVIETLFTEPVLGGLATEIRVARLDMATSEKARDHRLGFALELQLHYHTRRGKPCEPA